MAPGPNATNLIPTAVANRVLTAVAEQSAVLRLSPPMRMAVGQERIPVLSLHPTATFRSKHGGRRVLSDIEWSSEQLTPEPLPCVVMIPNDFTDDAGFPVWENAETRMTEAIADAVDAALINGTGAPTSFPTDLVTSASTALTPTADIFDAISAGITAVEETGVDATGVLMGRGAGGLLRDARSDDGHMLAGVDLPVGREPGQVYGLPMTRSITLEQADADFIVGSWPLLATALRQDVTFEVSRDYVATDGAGNVIVSAREIGATALIVELRVAAALGTPVNRKGGTVVPFKRIKRS